jgi:preprotein translocase subunit YajC
VAARKSRFAPKFGADSGHVCVAFGTAATIFRSTVGGPVWAATLTLEEFFMFVTPAYAQSAGGGGEILMSILPFLLIFVIMYFLIIRPQRTQMKKREEMLKNVRRGDQVITGGGILGKVTKVIDDAELEVEITDGVKVRLVRSLIADVRAKSEPVKE